MEDVNVPSEIWKGKVNYVHYLPLDLTKTFDTISFFYVLYFQKLVTILHCQESDISHIKIKSN